jgi:hypothetical protein
MYLYDHVLFEDSFGVTTMFRDMLCFETVRGLPFETAASIRAAQACLTTGTKTVGGTRGKCAHASTSPASAAQSPRSRSWSHTGASL